MRARSLNLSDSLAAVESELRSCRDALERAILDRENLQRQAASHLLEIDRLRQVSTITGLLYVRVYRVTRLLWQLLQLTLLRLGLSGVANNQKQHIFYC